MEEKETAEDGMKREMREELGIEIEIVGLIEFSGRLIILSADRMYITLIFIMRLKFPTVR